MSNSGLRLSQVNPLDVQGNGTKAQLFGGGSPNAGEFALYDAHGNVVSGGFKGAAKGDTLVYNGASWVNLGVGSNGQVLTADAAQAAGVGWEALPPSGPANGGAGTLIEQIPNGPMNSSNTQFTLNYSPAPQIIWLYLNGELQNPFGDYKLSGNTITYAIAPKAGDWQAAYYFQGATGSVSAGGSGLGAGANLIYQKGTYVVAWKDSGFSSGFINGTTTVVFDGLGGATIAADAGSTSGDADYNRWGYAGQALVDDGGKLGNGPVPFGPGFALGQIVLIDEICSGIFVYNGPVTHHSGPASNNTDGGVYASITSFTPG